MINCGRMKTVQAKSSNDSFKTWLLLRFKKTKDGSEPVSGNARKKWIDNRIHGRDDDEDGLYGLDYRLNVSPIRFKKTASNGKTMRELISEEYKSRIGKPRILIQETYENRWKSTFDHSRTRTSKLNSDGQAKWQNLKHLKLNEIMLKNAKPRKPVDTSKETHRKRSKHGRRRKVNGYSPRIKALEDMKRTRTRMKMMEIKDVFAIVKSSFDPQRDFRDSMMEMIITKGIKQRDELEELLACYLTLNCDEYHHLIVKVFQQVWLELNQKSIFIDNFGRFV